MTRDNTASWRVSALIALAAFAITVAGSSLACIFWLRDLQDPSVVFLGSGSSLSVLVTDGPARLLLAIGDDPIAFENAFLSRQPLFARRVDVLLVSGNGATLRVPEAARRAAHPRKVASLGTLPLSPETDALLPTEVLSGHFRLRLGSGMSVWIETRLPLGADPLESSEAWRLTVEHQGTRIVVYSDGEAVPLFPAARTASVVAVAGSDPLAFMTHGDGAAFVVNATEIDGPELRESLSMPQSDSDWTVRVHPGDAVRLTFTSEGVNLPSWAATPVNSDQ